MVYFAVKTMKCSHIYESGLDLILTITTTQFYFETIVADMSLFSLFITQ